MSAAKLLALAAEVEEAVNLARGLTEQVRLRGLTTETFGLPECDTVLIQKLRVMDPVLRDTIIAK